MNNYEELKEIIISNYEFNEVIDEEQINTIIKEHITNYKQSTSDNEYLKNANEYLLSNNIRHIINEHVNSIHLIQYKKKQVDFLQSLILPKQRTEGWYKMRETRLTASSLATALDKDKYKSKYKFIYDKINNTPYEKNEILEHGIKYEEIATQFYEHMNNVKILEFGMIPHPQFNMFGASPDGICSNDSPTEYIGRMLEIKCPPKRKFTKTVPEHYWMQIQGQLQCCELIDCDFLQVKISDYNSYEDYSKDIYLENDNIVIGYTTNKLPKGCIIDYIDEGDNHQYLYPGLFKSDNELNSWIKSKTDWINENNYKLNKTNWWKIERYECTLVTKDDKWWSTNISNIIQFWIDMEYYKLNPQELESKVNKSKKVVYISNKIDTDKCLL